MSNGRPMGLVALTVKQHTGLVRTALPTTGGLSVYSYRDMPVVFVVRGSVLTGVCRAKLGRLLMF